MNAQRLLALYERIADAPDAVGRLRRFVLDLAVRGKLVAQDARDEPATDLLKSILAARVQSGKAKKIADDGRGAALFGNDTPPFSVPPSWVWVPATLPALVHSDADNKVQTKDVLEIGRFPVVDQGKVFVRGYCNDETKVIRVDAPIIVFGDHTREVKLVDFDFVVGADGVKLLKPILLDPKYYYLALQWIPLESRGYGRHFKLLRESLLPLPPVSEQHRIVAKVDELMALCDRLEAARAQREATRDRLAAASRARLNAPDPDTFRDDARFALDALPALTTCPDQIKQLRQTILNLAVRGKLVAQDPEDYPALELLTQSKHWREEQIAARRIRESRKALPVIHNGEWLFGIPKGWALARLGHILYIRSGDGLTADQMKRGDIPVYGGNGVNGYHDRPNVTEKTIVIGRVGFHCGSIHVTPEKAWVTDNAFVTNFCRKCFCFDFLVLLLRATNLKENENATAQPVISGSKVYPIPAALPPLNEQHRIVAKVDELMALCDQLEASLAQGDTARRRLLDALLAEALAPAAVEDETELALT